MSVQVGEKRRTSALCKITITAAITLVLFLAGAGLFAQNALAQTYTIATCGDCHGDSPVDGARNATTGAVAGSHTKHASSGEYAYDCTVCHANVPRTPTPAYNHRDGNINMVSPLNAHSGSYDKGNTFPQTNTPTLSTCSTTYCHSTGTGGTTQTGDARPVAANTSPTWGNNGTILCSSCHGIGGDGSGRPNYASGSPKTNSHLLSKHSSLTCEKCHSQTTTTGNTITSKADHANRAYNVTGSGAEPFTFTYAYAPTGGGCATGYCHGTASPAWGTIGTLTCASCHSSMGAGGTALYTGKHQTHVDTAGYDYSCEMCHSLVNGTVHVDGPVAAASQSAQIAFRNSTTGPFVAGQTYNGSPSTYKFRSLAHNPYTAEAAVTPVYASLGTVQTDGSLKWSDAGTCSSVWCHSNANPFGGTNAYQAGLAWNSTLDCGSCHSKWNDASFTWSTPHTKHINYYSGNTNLTCNACHANTASNNTTVSSKATHVNASKDIAWNAFANSAAPAYNFTTHECQNVYCHGNGTTDAPMVTASWSGTTGCTSCHGDAVTLATGSHAKHLASPTSARCRDCHNATGIHHPGVTTAECANCHDNRTPLTNIDTIANHVNKAATINMHQLSGLATATYNGQNTGVTNVYQKTVGTAAGSCSNITCHNSGTWIYTASTKAGNTPQWGTAGGCNACHGNANYTAVDYRKAAPLYTSGSPKPNAHQLHVRASTSTQADPSCANCHSTTTADNTTVTAPPHLNDAYTLAVGGIYRDGDNVGGAAVAITMTPTLWKLADTPNITTCSNVSCHPTGLAGTKAASTTKWSDTYACTDCHNINMNNTTGYHHVMDAAAMASRTYPTAAPTSSATDTNRKCTMCHVDHDLFSPLLNASSTGRSMNLRTAIGTTPTTASGYTNSDYATGGGICISCHATGLAKNTTARKNDATTTTMVVTDAQYATSAHKYAVTSTMSNGSTTFNADCSKCHNAKNAETTSFQTAARQFGTHDASSKRLVAALGGTLVENYEEAFCYRCHSKAADAIGGTKKSADANDWYGTVTTMTAKSTAIYQAFQKTNRHPVGTYSGVHDAVETTAASFSGAERHVECADCHNLHAATAANPLIGATGINPTNGTAGAVPGSYTFVTVTDPDLQYQVCFKCHTNWAGTGTGTNAAVAFNPTNDSFHWVEKDKYTYAVNAGSGKGIWQNATFNRTTVPTRSYTYAGAMMPRYSAYTDAQLRTAPMRCSDCHGSDAADGGVAIPEGPHGSTRARILKTPSGSNYTVWNNSVTYQSASTIWCFNCHSSTFSGTGFMQGSNNLHTSKHNQRACQQCHLAVPHGQTASGTANQRQHLLSPSTFSDSIDTQNSGNYNESSGHGATLIGCT